MDLTTAEVEGLVGKAILDLLDGNLEPGVASALGGLARTLRDLRQTASFEERLAALETAAQQHQERKFG